MPSAYVVYEGPTVSPPLKPQADPVAGCRDLEHTAAANFSDTNVRDNNRGGSHRFSRRSSPDIQSHRLNAKSGPGGTGAVQKSVDRLENWLGTRRKAHVPAVASLPPLSSDISGGQKRPAPRPPQPPPAVANALTQAPNQPEISNEKDDPRGRWREKPLDYSSSSITSTSTECDGDVDAGSSTSSSSGASSSHHPDTANSNSVDYGGRRPATGYPSDSSNTLLFKARHLAR